MTGTDCKDGFQHGPPTPGVHLTIDEILLGIDGEVSSVDQERIASHISACWQCRALRDSITRSIADVSRLQNAIADKMVPQVSADRERFRGRLAALARELTLQKQAESWMRRLTRNIAQLVRNDGRSYPYTIAAVSSLVLLVLVILFFGDHRSSSIFPSLPPDELILRSTASDQRLRNPSMKEVVVQRIRISSGGRQLVRTVYRQNSTRRTASRTESVSKDVLPVSRILEPTKFVVDDLLSVDAFRRWRFTLPNREDRVQKIRSDLITLRTTTSAGPLSSLSMTFRTSDYRGVGEEFQFRDNTEIEVAELSFSVVPAAMVPPDVFGGAPEIEPVHLPVRSSLAQPTEADLARAMVDSIYALHQSRADMGEQVRVEPMGRSVHVQAVVADAERKQQLTAALQSIDHLKLDIVAISEMPKQQKASSAPGESTKAPIEVAATSEPRLEKELKARFLNEDQRIAYVNQTLALLQVMSARAWALNQLANQYPDRRVALLDEPRRQRLTSVLEDHLESLRQNSRQLQNRLSEVLRLSSNTAAANTRIQAEKEPTNKGDAPLPDAWQVQVHYLHSSVETARESVQTLLAGSNTADPEDLQSIEVGLRTTLTQVDAQIDAVSRLTNHFVKP